MKSSLMCFCSGVNGGRILGHLPGGMPLVEEPGADDVFVRSKFDTMIVSQTRAGIASQFAVGSFAAGRANRLCELSLTRRLAESRQTIVERVGIICGGEN